MIVFANFKYRRDFFLRINQFISKITHKEKSKLWINSDEYYLSSKDSINRIKLKWKMKEVITEIYHS